MTTPLPPSTGWTERVSPDEAERYARYADIFADIQRRKNARWGNGRTLHRKQLAAARGTLEVLDGIPAYAAHGLFAQPMDHEVWVRLSNGGFDRAPDRVPDIRGFALRVFGVEGDSALGNGPARSQDFTLINQEVFSFPDSESFVSFAAAASNGNGEMLKYLLRRHGVFGLPKQLALLVRTAAKPFSGFATDTLYSCLPMACGPYAVRVRLVPTASNGAPDGDAKANWGADFARRLAAGPLHWDMQLQYYADDTATPIEDPTVNWPTPYTTVARLMLPQQDLAAAEGEAFSQQVEGTVIDPWQALAAHRPLGDIQRARKAVYYRSQQGRGAA